MARNHAQWLQPWCHARTARLTPLSPDDDRTSGRFSIYDWRTRRAMHLAQTVRPSVRYGLNVPSLIAWQGPTAAALGQRRVARAPCSLPIEGREPKLAV